MCIFGAVSCAGTSGRGKADGGSRRGAKNPHASGSLLANHMCWYASMGSGRLRCASPTAGKADRFRPADARVVAPQNPSRLSPAACSRLHPFCDRGLRSKGANMQCTTYLFHCYTNPVPDNDEGCPSVPSARATRSQRWERGAATRLRSRWCSPGAGEWDCRPRHCPPAIAGPSCLRDIVSHKSG
jgi:hypothetical protein